MKVMKDMPKKIRSKERMGANNRWWVAELLAANCEKAWLHPEEEEETMQKFKKMLENMKKKDDKRKIEELHQQKVRSRVRKAVLGSCTRSRSPEHGEEEHRS